MTKRDLVVKISETTGIKQIIVKKIVQKTLDEILEALKRGEKIELRGFGVFRVKVRRPRVGRNPRTGEEVPIPERRVVVFKIGQEAKKMFT